MSGSDDGSIEHWSVLRKKPTHILKNAHAPQLLFDNQLPKEELIPNNGKTGWVNISSRLFFFSQPSCITKSIYQLCYVESQITTVKTEFMSSSLTCDSCYYADTSLPKF